jgi:glyoxylase-like metal-dependent hydrolase (beta-lactamase superfamily II)
LNQWQVGNVKITRVIEMEIAGGTKFILPQATRDKVREINWLAPHFADSEGKLIMSIHALVVETPTRKMIVDTCIGNDKQRSIPNWTNLQLPFLEDLRKAGYETDEIDTVMCTHLHVDHVGWNTMLVDGKWIPTFPNARYLMGKKEYEYWDKAESGNVNSDNADDLNQGVMGDSVRPVFDAGLIDLVEMDHRVCDEVFLEPTTGHTPGHVSIHIQSEGEEALITGDCIHHPCQIEHLDWASSADFDQTASTTTRVELMERYANRDILIIGTHFATPTAGHLKTKDNGAEGYWLDTGL